VRLPPTITSSDVERERAMHRRNLIIRRFGALDFGLGYFDDGVWVDHAAGDRIVPGTDTREPGSAPIDVVHEWLSCCDEPDGERGGIGERSIAVMHEPGLPVAAR
jgi:hypothetical protein